MKRSRSIRLVLVGGLAAGALAGCGREPARGAALAVFTNDTRLAGAGYYHAPVRAWYALPYNQYDPKTARWYRGGQWVSEPDQTITNVSAPTVQALLAAQAQGSVVHRGGFGGSARHHFVSS